jgi:hypothetical protein
MKTIKTVFALVLVTSFGTGCASTDSALAQSEDRSRADFQRDVRDYKRMQHQQRLVEQRSEGEKVTVEAKGIPAQSRESQSSP